MAEAMNDHERWFVSKAIRSIDSGHADVYGVRELLIRSCHSSAFAERFFEERLESETLLNILLQIAIEEYSGDAQMTASYWISQFPPNMLVPHTTTLAKISENGWESVAFHARRALEAIAPQGQDDAHSAADDNV